MIISEYLLDMQAWDVGLRCRPAIYTVRGKEKILPWLLPVTLSAKELALRASEEFAALGIAAPDIAVHGVAVPVIAGSDATVPGNGVPGIAAPRVAVFDVAVHGVAVPVIAGSGATVPGNGAPEIAAPRVAVSDVAVSDIAALGIAVSDIAEPSIAAPDIVVHCIAIHGVTVLAIAGSDITAPDNGVLEIAAPHDAVSNVAVSDIAALGIAVQCVAVSDIGNGVPGICVRILFWGNNADNHRILLFPVSDNALASLWSQASCRMPKIRLMPGFRQKPFCLEITVCIEWWKCEKCYYVLHNTKNNNIFAM